MTILTVKIIENNKVDEVEALWRSNRPVKTKSRVIVHNLQTGNMTTGTVFGVRTTTIKEKLLYEAYPIEAHEHEHDHGPTTTKTPHIKVRETRPYEPEL